MLEHFLLIGVVVFALGLLLAHFVVYVTRKPLREGQSLRRSHRVMLWIAVALVALGVVLGGIGYYQNAP